MKRVYLVVAVVTLVILVSAAVWAAQRVQGAGRPRQAPTAGMGRVGAPAIAVSGDYIYIVNEGKLLKYDTNLSLVTQTDLPAPTWATPGRGPGGGVGGGRRDGGAGGPRRGRDLTGGGMTRPSGGKDLTGGGMSGPNPGAPSGGGMGGAG